MCSIGDARSWSATCSARLMRRRTFLTTRALALGGVGLRAAETGDAARALSTLANRKRRPVDFAPVWVDWDRIIRTTVGLRSHRDSGFVLRAEKFDDKTVVHNYGHGGAGMS